MPAHAAFDFVTFSSIANAATHRHIATLRAAPVLRQARTSAYTTHTPGDRLRAAPAVLNPKRPVDA